MLHDKMKKLIEKKKQHSDGDMPEHEKHAKMSVLHELKRQAHEAMGQHLHGLKKVSVMSNEPEGLVAGLDKAKQLVEHAQDLEHDPLKDEIEPDDVSDTMDSDEDGDEGDGDNYSEPGVSEHSSEDNEEDEGGYEPEASDDHDMDENELHQKLAHLMALKEKLEAKKKSKV